MMKILLFFLGGRQRCKKIEEQKTKFRLAYSDFYLIIKHE